MSDKTRIIQQQYYGNISPGEQSFIAGTEYAKAYNLSFIGLIEKGKTKENHIISGTIL